MDTKNKQNKNILDYIYIAQFTSIGPGVVNSAMFAERAGFNLHKPLSREHF